MVYSIVALPAKSSSGVKVISFPESTACPLVATPRDAIIGVSAKPLSFATTSTVTAVFNAVDTKSGTACGTLFDVTRNVTVDSPRSPSASTRPKVITSSPEKLRSAL